MDTSSKTREFGDFQTPRSLAAEVCRLLLSDTAAPAAVVEPTCGLGALLLEAARQFKDVQQIVGVDINPNYVEHARKALAALPTKAETKVICRDFFLFDWEPLIAGLPQPILIVGNPPWVTNSALGSVGSTNLPFKSNFQGQRGIDALTGKSNFDISEWMIRAAFGWLNGRTGALAMLCKSSVARKVLRHAWSKNQQLQSARLFQIDAKLHFDAAVDACFLVVHFAPGGRQHSCQVFSEIGVSQPPNKTFGFVGNSFVSDVDMFQSCSNFHTSNGLKWRSGIKHDCAKVMQLSDSENGLTNGYDERVEIEPDFLFPLMKSSDLANGKTRFRRRWVIVTQRHVGEDTSRLKECAPRTWRYLNEHATAFDERSSSIYRGKPRFSIFGVGPYSFSPWKVAVSGLYKNLAFRAVGPRDGKPVVFDDTCYFLPCETEASAVTIAELLSSPPARQLLDALMFPEDKRPVTSQLLSQIDVPALADALGLPRDLPELANVGSNAAGQTALF